MGKFFFFLLALFPILLSGKETKKIIRQSFYPIFKETYYVLRSDTAVRHGSYTAETADRVLIEGYYKMGYMDSIWTHYNIRGKIISRGWYEKNKRDSIWEFFSAKGELEQKIDYSNNVLLQYKSSIAKYHFKVLTGKDTIISTLDRPPLFVGGTSRFKDYLQATISIPLHKSGEKVIGAVYVAFLIDSLGVTSNYRILKGIGNTCDNEALRALKAIPEDWMPGVLNGKYVSVDYIEVIQFDENTRTMEF